MIKSYDEIMREFDEAIVRARAGEPVAHLLGFLKHLVKQNMRLKEKPKPTLEEAFAKAWNTDYWRPGQPVYEHYNKDKQVQNSQQIKIDAANIADVQKFIKTMTGKHTWSAPNTHSVN